MLPMDNKMVICRIVEGTSIIPIGIHNNPRNNITTYVEVDTDVGNREIENTQIIRWKCQRFHPNVQITEFEDPST